jgi:hypothetical protein
MADTRKETGTGTAAARERVLEDEAVPTPLEELDEPGGRAGDELDEDAVEMDEDDEEEEEEDEDEEDADDEDDEEEEEDDEAETEDAEER